MSENGEIDGAGLEDTHPMEPNHEACYRALSTRDARFDGRFFIAVRTTRIYCRPICPARTPKRENVTFFTTASAAQEAGYRPCLRCRPESSPDLGAWRGTSNTVSRALTLIGEGALDGEAVDALAERLGVGERQLRRLFRQHLGASPIAVAQTRRVLFAKQLIVETTMPMAEVALASGFSSVRRFNATFHTLYRRSPRELRRSSLVDNEQAGAEGITLMLPYAPPYDWDAMLGFLTARAIKGIEAVETSRSPEGPLGRWVRATLSRRGSLSEGVVRLALAGGLQVSTVRIDKVFRDPGPSTASVRAMPVPDIADRRHRSARHQAADAGVVSRHASAWPRQEGNIQHRAGPAAWDLDQRCLAGSAQADASHARARSSLQARHLRPADRDRRRLHRWRAHRRRVRARPTRPHPFYRRDRDLR